VYRLDSIEAQQKLCAAAAPLFAHWPWQTRILDPEGFMYGVPVASGILACAAGLDYSAIGERGGWSLDQYLRNPLAVNLRSISLLRLERPPQFFYHLTRSPYLSNLQYLQIRAIDLSELDSCLGGEALVNLEELVVRATIASDEVADFPRLPLLKTVKRLSIYFHLGPSEAFLLNMLQSDCWGQLACFDLRGSKISVERVDFMIANWVEPSPLCIRIQESPAAKAANPAWAAYGFEWEGEAG
jgi:hypothetical protein